MAAAVAVAVEPGVSPRFVRRRPGKAPAAWSGVSLSGSVAPAGGVGGVGYFVGGVVDLIGE